MKRILSLTLASLFLLSALTACGGNKDTQTTPTPSQSAVQTPAATPTPSAQPGDDADRAQLFREAIEGARTDEENEVFTIVTDPGDADAELYLSILGLTAEDMTDFAISISPMNVRAYGIAVITPAEGKSETVENALNGFVDLQKSNFERYLEDQYAIAQAARVETLDDGSLVLVMSENQDDIFTSIQTALEG